MLLFPVMDKSRYTTPELARIVGLPMRKVLSFIERGYISPSIQDAAGHGSKRLWSEEDLVRLGIVSYLHTAVTVSTLRLTGAMLCDKRRLGPGEILTIPLQKPGDDSIMAAYSRFEVENLPPAVNSPAVISVSVDEIRSWVELRGAPHRDL